MALGFHHSPLPLVSSPSLSAGVFPALPTHISACLELPSLAGFRGFWGHLARQCHPRPFSRSKASIETSVRCSGHCPDTPLASPLPGSLFKPAPDPPWEERLRSAPPGLGAGFGQPSVKAEFSPLVGPGSALRKQP